MEHEVKHSGKLSPADLERAEFHERFARSFSDARFDGLRDAVAALEEMAWRQYCEQHPQRAPR